MEGHMHQKHTFAEPAPRMSRMRHLTITLVYVVSLLCTVCIGPDLPCATPGSRLLRRRGERQTPRRAALRAL